jgi:hypothetical protein
MPKPLVIAFSLGVLYGNTGDGFDSGKQWQSNLGGDENWKNRPTHENGERSMLIDTPPKLLCHCLPESKPLPVFRNT